MDSLPISVRQLIQELDDMYPERCPKPDDTEREIWMYAGKRAVVRHLKQLLEEGDVRR